MNTMWGLVWVKNQACAPSLPLLTTLHASSIVLCVTELGVSGPSSEQLQLFCASLLLNLVATIRFALCDKKPELLLGLFLAAFGCIPLAFISILGTQVEVTGLLAAFFLLSSAQFFCAPILALALESSKRSKEIANKKDITSCHSTVHNKLPPSSNRSYQNARSRWKMKPRGTHHRARKP